MFIQTNILFAIGIILIAATLISYIFRIIKQPPILAYILAGLLIGPHVLKIITNTDDIRLLAELGIAFLLFMVGLEIDLKKIKDVFLVSIFGGTIQIALLFLVGFLIALIFSFTSLEGIYLGLVIAFSSTMIVVKLLLDKNELGTLHGRIVLGILLVQDIVAILALSILSNETISFSIFLIALLKGIGLLLLAIIISKYIFPLLFRFASKSQELLFLSSIAICFFFALFAYSIGFSIVIGAFIAGVSLASLPYNYNIAGQIKPLRDFFLTLFFVSLGMELTFVNITSLIIPLIILVLIVIILKPWIIMFFTSLFGYKKRTSFITGLNLAQISEFSLTIVAQGLILGHVSQELFSLTVFLAIITLILTSYMIKYSNSIYQFFSKHLSLLEKLPSNKEELEYRKDEYDIVLFGCHRMGSVFLKKLKELKKKFLVVDYDSSIIKQLINEKINCIYGDIENEEVLSKIDFKKVKLVISTIPETEDSLFLLNYIRSINPKTLVFLTSRNIDEAFTLYNHKADYVILPRFISGDIVSNIIKDFHNKETVSKLRNNHIHHLLGINIYGE
ncbi:MAG: cation:proton antiporter [archaeon]